MKPIKSFILVLAILAISACQSSKDAPKSSVLLDSDEARLAAEILAPMKEPVTIQIIRGGIGETKGEEAQALVDLIAEISPMVTVNRLDIETYPDLQSLGVSHGPVIEMRGKAPGTLRYYGYPERREVRPFLEGILSASGHPTDLSPAVKSYISGLSEEVWIRIFVTPD